MYITILTLFPEMFDGPFAHSIVKRAQEDGHISIKLVNIRDYGSGKHKMVDDTAYGGGIGMVMKVDVLHEAIEKNRIPGKNEAVVLLSASGTPFTQKKAKSYAQRDHLMLLCGHYEGVDARINAFIDEEISIGDFVTTGGEIPAMLITDAVTRLIPGVLKPGATEAESFTLQPDDGSETGLLEYPHYTKPTVYKNVPVPEILLSGNHEKIRQWRELEARKKTEQVRPDLLKKQRT
jgi:tRNA (guanine37-N1)-methyltransferase